MPQPSTKPLSPLAAVLAGRAAAAPTPIAAPVPALRLQPAPPQRADITHTGGETAQELDQQLQQTTKEFRNVLVRIAYICNKLHEKDEWTKLGFQSEDEYFTARGHSTTWKMYVLLGARLSHLTIEEMQQIGLEAARLLAGISAKLWPEFGWVDEARMLPAKEFARLVRQRGASQKSLGEPKAAMSLKVPLTEIDQLERRFDLIRRQHHLVTPAATLDFMMRVTELGPGVVTAAEKLDQTTLELERVLELPEDLPEAARLVAKLKRHLKELHRRANGLPSEVSQAESSPAGGHPAA